MHDKMSDKEQSWPALPFAEWKDTCATLHMWTQIVGKVRLARGRCDSLVGSPALRFRRGLTTSSIPCPGGNFEISFDFIDHGLDIRTSSGASRTDRRFTIARWPDFIVSSWNCCARWESALKSGRCPSKYRIRFASIRTSLTRVTTPLTRVSDVLIEANGIRYFDGHGPDFYVDSQGAQHFHELAIKSGHRAMVKRDSARGAAAGPDIEAVIDEVETDFEVSAGEGIEEVVRPRAET